MTDYKKWCAQLHECGEARMIHVIDQGTALCALNGELCSSTRCPKIVDGGAQK